MAKRGRPRSTITLTVAEDPSLWKFASLQDALKANTPLIARLIQYSEQHPAQPDGECPGDESPVELMQQGGQ